MKKIIMLPALSFSLLITQSCNSDKRDSGDKKENTSVPAPVQSAFAAKYSTATDIKWDDAHENDKKTYKAKFTVNGKR